MVLKNEKLLIDTIKSDLKSNYPFQLPFHIGFETRFTKTIPIIDDGRKNGANCASYVVSLLEEVAGVCLDNG